MADSKHEYLLAIDHDEMITATYALGAAMGIVIEDTPMFERGVKELTNRYTNTHDHRVAIATLIEKLNAVHQVMRDNGECRD